MPNNPESSTPNLTKPQLARWAQFLDMCRSKEVRTVRLQRGSWVPEFIEFGPISAKDFSQQEISPDELALQLDLAADIAAARKDIGEGPEETAYGDAMNLVLHSSRGPAG